jgi:competence protein ComEC
MGEDVTLSADFLKVPHHGSRTSSTQGFLDRARSKVAVVSVGQDNPFGHPNADVTDRISADGARLYRTDRKGAVSTITDGREIEVHTFRGRW